MDDRAGQGALPVLEGEKDGWWFRGVQGGSGRDSMRLVILSRWFWGGVA